MPDTASFNTVLNAISFELGQEGRDEVISLVDDMRVRAISQMTNPIVRAKIYAEEDAIEKHSWHHWASI